MGLGSSPEIPDRAWLVPTVVLVIVLVGLLRLLVRTAAELGVL